MIERRGRSLRVGVGSTSMASRVMAAIVSKKRLITSSRLVSSPLQSPCKGSGAMWMRSISDRAMLAVSSSVFGLLCSSCVSHVAQVDRHDNTQVDLEIQPLRVDVVRFAVVVVVHLADDGGGEVTVLNKFVVVQPDDAKV